MSLSVDFSSRRKYVLVGSTAASLRQRAEKPTPKLMHPSAWATQEVGLTEIWMV